MKNSQARTGHQRGMGNPSTTPFHQILRKKRTGARKRLCRGLNGARDKPKMTDSTVLCVKPEEKTPQCTPNLLPCDISSTGPAPVSAYFHPSEAASDGGRTAHFRGRQLRGRHLPLPAGYEGLVRPTHQRASAVRPRHNARSPPNPPRWPCASDARASAVQPPQCTFTAEPSAAGRSCRTPLLPRLRMARSGGGSSVARSPSWATGSTTTRPLPPTQWPRPWTSAASQGCCTATTPRHPRCDL